jgi:hypothetical protein
MASRLERQYDDGRQYGAHQHARRQLQEEEEFFEEGPQRGWGETAYEFISQRFTDGSCGLWMGMGALAVGSLGLLVTKTVYALFVSTPSIWGTIPAGVITGITTGVAIPLSHKMPRVLGENVKEENQKALSVALSVFLISIAFIPTVSKFVCPQRVSYLGAATYGILGALAAAGFSYMDHKAEKKIQQPARHGQERPRAVEQHRRYTYEDYKRLGIYSGCVGLVTGVVAGIFLSLGTICAYLGEKAPILKGSLSVGAVGGISTCAAVLTLDFEKLKSKRTKDNEKMFHMGTRVAAAFVATVALAPTLSRYLTSYHVGYLQAAGLSVAGMVGGAAVGVGGFFLLSMMDG